MQQKLEQKSYSFKRYSAVNPCEHIKKVPPRHQSHNCGSTLNVVHRKLKAVGILILSA